MSLFERDAEGALLSQAHSKKKISVTCNSTLREHSGTKYTFEDVRLTLELTL